MPAAIRGVFARLAYVCLLLAVGACSSPVSNENPAASSASLTEAFDLCGTWRRVELSATLFHEKNAYVPLNGTTKRVFCEPIGVRIPTELAVAAGRPGNGWAELDLETQPYTVTCRYKGSAAATPVYELKSCNRGVRGSQVVQARAFTLRVVSGDAASGPTTARVALDSGATPPPSSFLEFYGKTPQLAGVTLRVPVGSVQPFSGVGLADGPNFEARDFVASDGPGLLVAGPSVTVTGTGSFGPGVRLVTPADLSWAATLPTGSLDTLGLVNVREVLGPSEAIELGDRVLDSTLNTAAASVDAGLAAPGNYLTAIRDLTPIWNHGGPTMDNGVAVYIIWAGVFDGKPDDPRPAVRRFLGDLGSSAWNEIQTTYQIANRAIRLGGEFERKDVTSFSVTPIWKIVKKALDDGSFKAADGSVIPPDPNGIYLVLGAPGVSGANFCVDRCGEHTSQSYGTDRPLPVKFGYVGHGATCPNDWTCGIPQFGPTPNGKFVDRMLSTLAHEIVETVTDPELSAWHGADEPGYANVENADKCSGRFPSRESTTADTYNLTVGPNRYLIQANWVNQDGGYCAMGIESVDLQVVSMPTAGLAINEIGTFVVRVTNTSKVFYDANRISITGRASGLLAADPLPVSIGALAPGQSVDLTVFVQAPYEIGGNVEPTTFVFSARDPRNDHSFPNSAEVTLDVRRAPFLIDQAECEAITLPASVNSYQWFSASMRFKNTGTTVWLPGDYRLMGLPLEYPAFGPIRLGRTVGIDDSVDFTFNVWAAAAPGEVLSLAGSMANKAAAFPQGCAGSVLVNCVSNMNSSCGSCGGVVLCDGSCSFVDPPAVGQSCSQCGSTQCDGSCWPASPPEVNQPCGCNGTYQCDGSCSRPGPPDLGMPCNCGVVLCDGSCSNPPPGDFGTERTTDIVESFGAFASYTKTFYPSPGWNYVSCTMTRNSGGGFGLLHPSSEANCTADFASTGFLNLEGASFTIRLTERRTCD